MNKLIATAFIVSLAFAAIIAEESSLARGWGDKIQWRTLEAALAESKETNKPVMVIIHKTWCGACKRLKPLVAASEEIEKQSENFIMVNLEDNEEPKDPAYAPDGAYIPRIVYVDTTGKVRSEILNAEREKQRYFYHDATAVLKGMKNALEVLSRPAPASDTHAEL
mmetsp:Transcript_14495/g.20204  ORF Transcript_14495/g.20204 Transcript_14495/m.20204 type:complete len:166 (+) Transcript_14495:71-568(+)